jgi:hypothetical protein
MMKARDPGNRRWCSPLRVITAVTVGCVLGVAVQDASVSAGDSRPGAVAGNTTIERLQGNRNPFVQ